MWLSFPRRLLLCYSGDDKDEDYSVSVFLSCWGSRRSSRYAGRGLGISQSLLGDANRALRSYEQHVVSQADFFEYSLGARRVGILGGVLAVLALASCGMHTRRSQVLRKAQTRSRITATQMECQVCQPWKGRFWRQCAAHVSQSGLRVWFGDGGVALAICVRLVGVFRMFSVFHDFPKFPMCRV